MAPVWFVTFSLQVWISPFNSRPFGRKRLPFQHHCNHDKMKRPWRQLARRLKSHGKFLHWSLFEIFSTTLLFRLRFVCILRDLCIHCTSHPSNYFFVHLRVVSASLCSWFSDYAHSHRDMINVCFFLYLTCHTSSTPFLSCIRKVLVGRGICAAFSSSKPVPSTASFTPINFTILLSGFYKLSDYSFQHIIISLLEKAKHQSST